MHLFIRLNYIILLIFNHFWPTKNDNTYIIYTLSHSKNTSQSPGKNMLRERETICLLTVYSTGTLRHFLIPWLSRGGLAARAGQRSSRKVSQRRSLAGWKGENSTCIFPVSLLLLQWQKRVHVPGSAAAEGKMLAQISERLEARAPDQPCCQVPGISAWTSGEWYK